MLNKKMVLIGGLILSLFMIPLPGMGEPEKKPDVKPETKAEITPELQAKIEQLIKQLGNEDVQIRDKAKEELTKIGTSALTTLNKATKDKDPERVRRAEKAIEEICDKIAAEYFEKEKKDNWEKEGTQETFTFKELPPLSNYLFYKQRYYIEPETKGHSRHETRARIGVKKENGETKNLTDIYTFTGFVELLKAENINKIENENDAIKICNFLGLFVHSDLYKITSASKTGNIWSIWIDPTGRCLGPYKGVFKIELDKNNKITDIRFMWTRM